MILASVLRFSCFGSVLFCLSLVTYARHLCLRLRVAAFGGGAAFFYGRLYLVEALRACGRSACHGSQLLPFFVERLSFVVLLHRVCVASLPYS